MTPEGAIPDIWIASDDPPAYVNIKLGAINAFQTHLLNETGKTLKVLEDDPTGKHYATMEALATTTEGAVGGVQMHKTFDTAQMVAYADPSVSPGNMGLNAHAVAHVHPEGYIQAATVTQTVVMVDATPGAKAVQGAYVPPLTPRTAANVGTAST